MNLMMILKWKINKTLLGFKNSKNNKTGFKQKYRNTRLMRHSSNQIQEDKTAKAKLETRQMSSCYQNKTGYNKIRAHLTQKQTQRTRGRQDNEIRTGTKTKERESRKNSDGSQEAKQRSGQRPV